MIQFYFMSVLLNLFGGYALAIDATRPRGTAFDGIRASLSDHTIRLVLGILCAVTGAFKLLTVVRGDIPIVGDFLPALAGLAVGLTLLLELYRDPEAPFKKTSTPEPDGRGAEKAEEAAGGRGLPVSRLETFFIDNKAAVGVAGMIAALVHFLFPMVLFL